VSGKSYAEVVGLIQRLRDNLSLIVVPKQDDILQMVRKNLLYKNMSICRSSFLLLQYFSDIAQNPETNQRPTPSRDSLFNHQSGYLPTTSRFFYQSRESSPYSELVNNFGGAQQQQQTPTRMAGGHQGAGGRVPEPILPPWATSEHVYAMPARVIRNSAESVEHEPIIIRDPRSVGSLVSLASSSTTSPWRGTPTTTTSSRTLCDSEAENTNEADPVINRIKRDFERKQEFLRTTNLPNYLGSPTPTLPPIASPEPDFSDFRRQQQEQQPNQIVQGEPMSTGRPLPPPPVYFGDRYPVHNNRDVDQEGRGQGQFHLYGLQLGKK
jgi:hypothetical protein